MKNIFVVFLLFILASCSNNILKHKYRPYFKEYLEVKSDSNSIDIKTNIYYDKPRLLDEEYTYSIIFELNKEEILPLVNKQLDVLKDTLGLKNFVVNFSSIWYLRGSTTLKKGIIIVKRITKKKVKVFYDIDLIFLEEKLRIKGARTYRLKR